MSNDAIRNLARPDVLDREEPMAEGRGFLIEGLPLSLPPDHGLPKFQAEHVMYDRFLPELARCLEGGANTTIIDVGANVGDTALAMVSHCKPRILCVDGFSEYFSPTI
jgi:hypothetical protein